jgi:pimeloyl-ACP methyl ester carboxylesterase
MHHTAFELQNRFGLRLRGDVRTRDRHEQRPVVVCCHGFKGFKDWGFWPWVGARLAAAGFTAVQFNFSGSGVGANLLEFDELEVFARDTVSKQLDDLGVVLDALFAGGMARGCADLRHVMLLGHSRGGGVAVLRARADARIDAVATWAAVSKVLRWSEAERRVWRTQGFMSVPNARTGQDMRVGTALLDDLEFNAGGYDLVRAASELRVPLLVAHGDADETVPAAEGSALYGAAPDSSKEFLLLPRAGHTFGAEHPWKGSNPALDRLVAHTIDWLQRVSSRSALAASQRARSADSD